MSLAQRAWHVKLKNTWRRRKESHICVVLFISWTACLRVDAGILLLPWIRVHWCPAFLATRPISASLNQVSSADRHWNVAFFKSPLLLIFQPWSDHASDTEFVGENVRHRLLTPTHLQVPWILIDLLYSCLPDLIHCYLSCGKLLQPPFPSSRLWAKHLSIQTWLTAAAAMCKAE